MLSISTFVTSAMSRGLVNPEHALKRIEKLVQIKTPDTFEFTGIVGKEIARRLIECADGSEVHLSLQGVDYFSIYQSVTDKFMKSHPMMAQFDSILTSGDLCQMAEKVSWLLMFGVTRKRARTDEMVRSKNMIYDGLARTFSELRRKLATMSSIADRFVELWSSAICASMFTMIMKVYENELYRNYPFITRMENDIRDLLVGFSSPYLQDYHRSIMLLIPKELKLAFPMRLGVGGDDDRTDLKNAIKYEPEIVKEWKQRKNTLFMASTQTELMKHAMKLTGVRNPVEVKTHVVQRGSTEKSHLKVSKAQEIVKQTGAIVKKYEDDRQRVLDDLYDEELHYEETSRRPRHVPLGISFNRFGVERHTRPPATAPGPRPKVDAITATIRADRMTAYAPNRPNVQLVQPVPAKARLAQSPVSARRSVPQKAQPSFAQSPSKASIAQSPSKESIDQSVSKASIAQSPSKVSITTRASVSVHETVAVEAPLSPPSPTKRPRTYRRQKPYDNFEAMKRIAEAHIHITMNP